MQEETITEIEADNAHWDALLVTDASQNLLTQLADEALAEHKAGKTKSLNFDKNGHILPS